MPKREIELGPTGRRVGPAVRRLREGAGLTQEDLAERLGRAGRPMLATSLARLEVGQRRVDVDDLVALAVALDCSIGELLLLPRVGFDQVELTSTVVTAERDAWAWMTGDRALPGDAPGVFDLDRAAKFEQRAAPHRSKPGRQLPISALDSITTAEWRAINKLVAAHGSELIAAVFDLTHKIAPLAAAARAAHEQKERS